eukprot:2355241-Alexandrium_andersonii.AAC.1
MEDVYKGFLKPLEQSETSDINSLRGVIAEKNPNFNVRDLPAIRKLVDGSHLSKADASESTPTHVTMQQTLGN